MATLNKEESQVIDNIHEINPMTEEIAEGDENSNSTKESSNEYNKVKLLFVKKHKVDEMDEENDEPEINTLRSIEEIVDRWIRQEKVIGVINNDESDPEKNIIIDLTTAK